MKVEVAGGRESRGWGGKKNRRGEGGTWVEALPAGQRRLRSFAHFGMVAVGVLGPGYFREYPGGVLCSVLMRV